METKHTQGKWLNKPNGASFRIDIDEIQLTMIPHIYGKSQEEADANAKLIAAAPELLEALIAFVNAYPKPGKFKDEFSNDVISDEITDPLYINAVKAIKKATDGL